jgi:predicted nuclease with TOPRIM domain
MATSDDPLLMPTESESPDSLTESLHKLETRLARLNERIQSIEDSVTDEAFHWEDRFENLE